MNKLNGGLLIALIAIFAFDSGNAVAIEKHTSSNAFREINQFLKDPKPEILHKEYVLGNENLTWFAARYYCESKGWRLISIQNLHQHLDLLGFLGYYELLDKPYWTSGNKLEDYRTWRWDIDGPQFNYTNWATGNPTPDSKKKACIAANKGDLSWSDDDCFVANHFICRKNLTDEVYS